MRLRRNQQAPVFTLQKFIFDASNKIEFQLPGSALLLPLHMELLISPGVSILGIRNANVTCVKKSVPNYVPGNLSRLIWQELPLLRPAGSPANKKTFNSTSVNCIEMKTVWKCLVSSGQIQPWCNSTKTFTTAPVCLDLWTSSLFSWTWELHMDICIEERELLQRLKKIPLIFARQKTWSSPKIIISQCK